MHPSVSIARDLIAIPSVNPMGEILTGPEYSEKDVATYLHTFFKRHGIDSKVSGKEPDHPNVTAHIDVNSTETVLLEAHMDTVPHQDMEINPFDPVIRDGLLYGRGSCDTKASLAAYMYAVSHVLQSGKQLRRNVILSGVHDEEYSFGGSRELIADGVKATFAIIGEPTSLNIVYAHKGLCRFHIRTKGKSAHAALPWLGENAAYEMADVLHVLRNYSNELLKNQHAELGSATLNVGRIWGGSAVNTVPAQCTIDIDHRLLPGESYKGVKEILTDKLGSLGRCVEIGPPYMEAAGVYNPKDGIACREIQSASLKAKWKPDFCTAHYATDASIISTAGIPSAVFGPGSVELAHTKAECVPIREVELASNIIIALLTEV